MSYFTKEFISFFRELRKNNNKEWFHSNKKRYEAHVKNPMRAFVTDLISEMNKTDKTIDVEPKKCIGRINRDIRFSKDKTPYNVHLFAHVTQGSRMDPKPEIAFRFGGYDSGIMSGYYSPSKDRLLGIRNKIKADPKAFEKLYSNKKFVKQFGSIQGEANKRIPPAFKAMFEQEPLIANKQFYYVKEFDEKLILQDDLLKTILDHWKTARPLNEFFSS